MTLKETKIIDGIKAGDEEVIGRFMSEYQKSLMTQALRIVKVREDAEEVVQDTFAIVCRKIGMFNGNSSLYTWVSRILINCALMKVRSRRVEQRVIVRSLDELVGDGLDLQRMDCNNSGRVYLEQAHTKPKVGVKEPDDALVRINLVAVRDNRACGGRKFRRVKYGKSGLTRFKTPWSGGSVKEAV